MLNERFMLAQIGGGPKIWAHAAMKRTRQTGPGTAKPI